METMVVVLKDEEGQAVAKAALGRMEIKDSR
jgi:hypothetical protein